MLRKVTGQKDPIITLLRHLTTEDGRRSARRFFAEGEELVLRAFDYGGKVDALILTERFASSAQAAGLVSRAEAAGAEVCVATEGLIAKTLEAKPVPECIAVAERGVVPLSRVLSGKTRLVLMVEHGENADNLGMLLRSTDAAGVDGVVLAADTTDPFARRVVRGSRGAVFTVPICIQPDPVKVIEEARAAGFQIVSSSARSDIFHTKIDYTAPTMLIVGNEHVGVSDTVRSLSDAVVRIPMRGRINSLNIAVAASILMYEVLRQRGMGG